MDIQYWGLLPPEITPVVLLNASSFESVIGIATVSQSIRQLLSCSETPVNLSLQFVNEPPKCSLSAEQPLQQLNAKFNLGVKGELTFPRLKRAYYRSANNPQCLQHSSLIGCLKSAAVLGITDSLEKLLTAWDEEYTRFQVRIETSPTLSVAYPEDLRNPTMLHRLAIRAYKNNHLQLGDIISGEIITLDNISAYNTKIVYWRCKAHMRVILAPFKVSTTRAIRAKYASVLFDPNVSDIEKTEIWRSKYQLDVEIDIFGVGGDDSIGYSI